MNATATVRLHGRRAAHWHSCSPRRRSSHISSHLISPFLTFPLQPPGWRCSLASFSSSCCSRAAIRRIARRARPSSRGGAWPRPPTAPSAPTCCAACASRTRRAARQSGSRCSAGGSRTRSYFCRSRQIPRGSAACLGAAGQSRTARSAWSACRQCRRSCAHPSSSTTWGSWWRSASRARSARRKSCSCPSARSGRVAPCCAAARSPYAGRPRPPRPRASWRRRRRRVPPAPSACWPAAQRSAA
mmetsp:Transcript_5963/g.15618  ORF Transcript_5963/g.15618 Transcript_5963/m.15618 type:complete len:244 (-) Transcript_5963:234-965(-)